MNVDIKSFIDNEVKNQINKQVLSICDNQDMTCHYDWIILLLAVVLLLSFGFLYFLWSNENSSIQYGVKLIITIIYIIIAIYLIYHFVINKSTKNPH